MPPTRAALWFDPSCPLSRMTARWLQTVAAHRAVELSWHVMSLSVLNEHLDDDPEGDVEGWLWVPVRVCAAVEARHGSDALGRLHDALWDGTEHGTGERTSDLADALERAGLPRELADLGTTDVLDDDVRRLHAVAMSHLDRDDVGSPILVITGADGSTRACFGPVLDELPPDHLALQLWDGLAQVLGVPQLREIKG